MNKPKPDDRSDNAAKIKESIEATKDNIKAADKMMAESDNPGQIDNLKEKNERREEAIKGKEAELKQETEFANNQGE